MTGGMAQAVTPPAAGLNSEMWPLDSGSPSPEYLEQVTHNTVSQYLATTDTITRDGGEDPRRMKPHTTEQWFLVEDGSFSHYRALGLRTVGDTVFDQAVVQSLWWPRAGGVEIHTVACVDARGVWLLSGEAPDPPAGLFDWLYNGANDDEAVPEDIELWQEYLDTHQPEAGVREPVVFYLVGDNADSLVVDGTLNWEGANWCHITPID